MVQGVLGAGKTSVCREFIRRHRSGEIAWFDKDGGKHRAATKPRTAPAPTTPRPSWRAAQQGAPGPHRAPAVRVAQHAGPYVRPGEGTGAKPAEPGLHPRHLPAGAGPAPRRGRAAPIPSMSTHLELVLQRALDQGRGHAVRACQAIGLPTLPTETPTHLPPNENGRDRAESA